MITLEPLEVVSIEIEAARKACEENPHYCGRLGDIMTDDHYKQGIRAVFGELPEFTEDVVIDILQAYHDTKEIMAHAQDAGEEAFEALIKSWRH